MPRFYFDVEDDAHFVRDDDGTECIDLEAARAEALQILPDVAQWALPDGDRRTIVSWVRDAAGQLVLAATLTVSVRQLQPVI